MKKFLAFLLAGFSLTVHANIPEYKKPVILARANLTDGLNLPPMSFLNNTCPVINNRGDVAFKVMSSGEDSSQAVWFKGGVDENGKIIYNAPEMRFLTDPSLNDQGKMAFNLYDEGITDGVFTLDGMTSKVDQTITPENDDIAFYTYSQVLSDGKIYFRGTDQDNTRTFYQFDGKLKKVIAEGTSSYGQKSSYLFKPSLNDSGSMSFKRRLGDKGQWDESQGDEILLLKPNGSNFDSVVIAKDKDSDPQSAFKGFTNTTSLSASGLAAFTAYLDDGAKAVILYKDGALKNVATEKVDQISEIELFAPKVNDQGLVVFRAKNMEGKRGIYLADQTGVKRLIGEGDEVETDLGKGIILSNPNYPGFGGEVDMNDHGEIVFYCLIVGSKDNKEWGSAVFKISPQM
ncbi:MAG: hypothetical protein K2Q18_06170 [Bdellovibrionales bacterium]|nr:hypothetical protein [Bdellovibrionales bacterium]